MEGLNPWAIVVSSVVFIGILWFATRDTESKYPREPEDSSHRKEKYTITINIALNAKPLLSNSKGLLPEGESIFTSFEIFNESKDSKKEQETGGQKGGD